MTNNNAGGYSLLEEPWIHVIDMHDNEYDMGLLELFRKSDSLSTLKNESTIQDVSILRLLISIVYRALDPVLESDWESWYPNNLPIDRIISYLHDNEYAFNMFDDRHPFFQEPDIVPKDIDKLGTSGLRKSEMSGEGALFAFRRGASADSLSFDMACRRLITSMQFEVQGNHSTYHGANEKIPHAAKTLPSASSLSWIQGDTIASTLLLNVIPLDSDTIMDSIMPDEQGNISAGIPSWETPPIGDKEFNNKMPLAPHSILDVLTWRNRKIHIYDGGGKVGNALVTKGIPMDIGAAAAYDTMSSWKIIMDKNTSKTAIIPRQYHRDQERRSWQGMRTLLESNFKPSDDSKPARIFARSEELINNGILPLTYIADVHTLTPIYDSKGASLKNVIHDYLPLPIHDIQDDYIRETILKAITIANDVGVAYGRFIIGCRMAMGERPLHDTTYTAREAAGAPLYAKMEPLFQDWIRGDKDLSAWCGTLREITLHSAEYYMKSLPISSYYGRMVNGERISAAKSLNILRGTLYNKERENS